MPYPIKQSTTAQPLMFLMVDSTDHVSAKTGLTPTVTLSKAGGSFASPAGAVSEVGSGWYKVAGNATDTGTLGPLVLHATGTAADPTDVVYWVQAQDPQDAVRAGLTALPNAAADAAGGLPISDAGGLDLDAKIGALTFTVAGKVDANNTHIAGSAVSTSTAQLGVNVVNFGGSAGTFASGRPEVNTTHWGGTAVASATVNANATQISGDSTAADNAELFFDGTGYNASNSTIGTATTIGSTGIAAIWSYAKASAAALATTTIGRYIYDKLAYLTSATELTARGLVSTGDIITVYQGESILNATGNAIELEVDPTELDLTGYTPRFGITKVTSNSGTSALEITGTVISAGSAGQKVRFEMTKAQTAALALSTGGSHAFRVNGADYYAYRWSISAFSGASNCPMLGQGWVDVKAKDTTCA